MLFRYYFTVEIALIKPLKVFDSYANLIIYKKKIEKCIIIIIYDKEFN